MSMMPDDFMAMEGDNPRILFDYGMGPQPGINTERTIIEETMEDDEERLTRNDIQDIVSDFYNRQSAQDTETATSIITNVFSYFGLDDPELVTALKTALAERRITGGSSVDDIGVQLRENPAFQRRFSANEARRKAGKPQYTISQYLELENAYRSVLLSGGMESGFYDSPEDFQRFIERDISPEELRARVQQGYQAVREADPAVVNELKTLYGLNDNQLAEFFIDPDRARDSVIRAARAAEIASQARQQASMALTAGEAELLARQGITQEQARAGFGQIQLTEQLFQPQMQGEEAVSREDIIAGTFGTNAAAAQRIATRQRRRRAAFEEGGQVTLGTVE
jgi:hypothetical protein